MTTTLKSKFWMITTNNYSRIDYMSQWSYKCDYIIIGKEVGKKCGVPHIHTYIEFTSQKRFETLKKAFPKSNLQIRRGTAQECRNYVMKDGNFEERGTISQPQQGARNDLRETCDKILEGYVDVDDIAEEDPNLYHLYGRTLMKSEDLYLRKQFRTTMTKCKWLCGTTSTGKSHYLFKDYNPNTHYLWKLNDNGWQDGYKQQKIVCINDFRGEIPYNELLQMIDKWPHTVRRRGKEPMPFTSELVLISSSLHPRKIYKNRDVEDSMDQLLRRIEIIEMNQKFTEMPSKYSEGNTNTSESELAEEGDL